MTDECRYFVEDDGTSYLEEKGVVHKRWPAPAKQEPEQALAEDQLMDFIAHAEAIMAMGRADAERAKWVARQELHKRLDAIWEVK